MTLVIYLWETYFSYAYCFHCISFYFNVVDLCQLPYMFSSTSLGTFSYNVHESSSSSKKVNDLQNNILSFDGRQKMLYLYNMDSDSMTSYNLNGSEISTIEISNVDFFSVDGRNNLIYYHHSQTDKINVYNMTSDSSALIDELNDVSSVKDLEFDMTNG